MPGSIIVELCAMPCQGFECVSDGVCVQSMGPNKDSPSPFPSADRWMPRDSMETDVFAKILDAQLQKKRREETLAATMREAQQSRNSGGMPP